MLDDQDRARERAGFLFAQQRGKVVEGQQEPEKVEPLGGEKSQGLGPNGNLASGQTGLQDYGAL